MPKNRTPMTQKQLLEHVSNSFKSVNVAIADLRDKIASLEKERSSMNDQQFNSLQNTSQNNEEFLFDGGFTCLLDITSGNQFARELKDLMIKYKVIGVDMSLHRRL